MRGHFFIGQILSVHGPHMNTGLVVLGYAIEIQTGIAREYRHAKCVKISFRFFSGIFQRCFPIFNNLRQFCTVQIFEADQFNPKTGKAVTHRVEFCRVAGSVQ